MEGLLGKGIPNTLEEFIGLFRSRLIKAGIHPDHSNNSDGDAFKKLWAAYERYKKYLEARENTPSCAPFEIWMEMHRAYWEFWLAWLDFWMSFWSGKQRPASSKEPRRLK